jgi:citron Rho-interacting kinase
MFSFFAHPIYFYGLILALLVISLIAVFSIGEEDKKTRKKQEDELLEARLRNSELEKNIGDKEFEYRATLDGLEKALKDKETEFNQKVGPLEAQIKQQEVLKAELSKVKPELDQKEDVLRQALAANDILQKELAQLKEELDKTKNELALSNQMYNGLKGQYDELEDKFSQLFEEFLKEQKKNLTGQSPKAAAQESRQKVDLPKIPNLRSSVQNESEEDKVPPAGTKPE